MCLWTAKMLLGLTAPTRGSFTIDGKHFPNDRLKILREIGSFIEAPSFYANLTGRENLDVIRRILGLRQSAVEDALELVGLHESGDRLAKKYSLGMKQRLGLAGALLGRPPILILDEPTNGLDPSGIHEIRNLVKSLPDLYDCTVLISSHMLSEIELMADDVGILNHGRLGAHHAMSARKNLILMTGSFALSIILFLTFSVLLDFVGYLLPQSVADADVTITGETGVNCVPLETVETLRGMDGVKRIFGRRSVFEVPAELGQEGLPQAVDLISFDDFDLEALKKDGMLKKGSNLSKVYGDNGYVLAVCDPDAPLHTGDTIQVDGEALTVAGMLKYDMFSGDGLAQGSVSIITSSETFVRLTGVTGYSLVMIQTAGDVTDEAVAAMRAVLDEGLTLQDQRELRTSGTYTAFVLCVYGFLAIIAMVTLLNIMNSISMSVSAKSKQYGAMRAVGMESGQATRIIAAEAVTYALAGCVIGCAAGLVLGRMLYGLLIDGRFPYAVWTVPVSRPLIVVGFVAAATLAAIHAPAKRMREMAVTETVNGL